MWYCVIRLSDYRIVYHGTDESSAVAANVLGTHLVAAKNFGRAQAWAAIDAGYLNRGETPPQRN